MPEAETTIATAEVVAEVATEASAELPEYLLVTAADGDPGIAAVPPPAVRSTAPAAALI